MEQAERPRYLHLLSDQEIRDLHPMLVVLRDHRDAVIGRWHDLYGEHFGEARTLSEAAFRDLYGRDLDALILNLLDGDMEGFEVDIRSIGHELVERSVPFGEVVASLHLFEESATEQFQTRLASLVKGPRIHLTFDKLSHCRMILLAGAYFAGHRAETGSRLRGLEQEAGRLAGGPGGRDHFHGLVGGSAPMRRVYEQIAAAAGGQGAVLVAGESGTGKELAARALHECARPDRPFVAVNCAALPRELIESELFGHKKGAYTGAQGEYLGLVRAASGGTLFLDEITEMSAETQAKLLRVLEERMVRPVGVAREVPVDVRFVASTNRDPEKAVEAGLLRKDLFYRLNVHRIAVPPLRERLEDVPLLAVHFASLLRARGLRPVDGLDEDAVSVLQRHSWPGNVRELRNAIEQALAVGKAASIGRLDLPPYVVRAARVDAGQLAAPANRIPTFEEAERELIGRALDATEGNKLQAARLLRISRHRLYDKLRKFGIEK